MKANERLSLWEFDEALQVKRFVIRVSYRRAGRKPVDEIWMKRFGDSPNRASFQKKRLVARTPGIGD